MNSRQKGARGERMFRDVLREHGFTARRGQQFAGGADSPDVICDELNDRFHFEVKNVTALRLHDAVDQAGDDAGGKVPVVAYKRKHGRWYAILPMDDFLNMTRETQI